MVDRGGAADPDALRESQRRLIAACVEDEEEAPRGEAGGELEEIGAAVGSALRALGGGSG